MDPTTSTPPIHPSQTVAIICHTHWDREWYWPAARYQVRLVEVLYDVLDAIESGDLPCFTLDGQTALLTDACQLAPSLAPRLRAAIQADKISVGPWFTAPDEWLVCGESLLRNLLLGMTEAKEWGSDWFTGYLPDTFGHSRDMPTLLNHMGIQTAIGWRGFCTTDEKNHSPLFWWQGADQSRLLTLHLRQGYFNNTLHDVTLSLDEQENVLNEWISTQCHNSIPTYLSLGGDHLGPLSQTTLQWLREKYFLANNLLPQWTQASHYMKERLEEEKNPATSSVFTLNKEALDNRSAYVLHGVWSSRLDIKQRNRKAEHRLLHWIEPWWALVQDGLNTAQNTAIQGAWKEAWRLLLLNHPHDSICGCSVDEVHRENHGRFDRIETLLTAIEDRLGSSTKSLLNKGSFVINISSSIYTGVIPITHRGSAPPKNNSTVWYSENTHLIDDYRTDHQHVPLSHLTEPLHQGWLWVSQLAPGAHPLDTVLDHSNHSFLNPDRYPRLTLTSTSTGWELTNEHLTIRLNTRLSLLNRLSGQEVPLYFMDEVDTGDSYTRCPSDQPQFAEALNNWEWTLQSPFIYQGQGTILLQGEPICLSITLKAGASVAEFKAQWVNTRPNHALSVWFKTPQPITHVMAESHCGSVERSVNPDHPRLPPKPLDKNQEWVPNTGPLQRWLTTNSLYLVTQGLSEYETRGANIGITLLRCFGQISAGSLATRTGAAGPPFETPDGQHLNQTVQAQWAAGFLPSENLSLETITTWGNAQATRYYGQVQGWSQTLDPITVQKTPSQAFLEPPISWENTAIERQCLKPHHSQPGVWVLRLLNLSSEKQAVHLNCTGQWAAYPCTGLEELNGLSPSPVQHLTLLPHQLVSFLLQRNS